MQFGYNWDTLVLQENDNFILSSRFFKYNLLMNILQLIMNLTVDYSIDDYFDYNLID